MELNSYQRKALEITQGPLIVLAGPGTGKTRLITLKILRMQELGIDPSRILALTFSNKAVEELSSRLPPHLLSKVEVSTLHAWCNNLIRRHSFRLGFQRPATLMTKTQAEIFFRQMSAQLPLQPFLKTASIDAALDPLMKILGEAKEHGLWPEDLIRHKDEWESIGDVYNAYQNHCFQKGFLDFGDCILFALRLLEDFSSIREEIQNSFDFIVVDEFQDTNLTQVKLLKNIYRPGSHICVVGDDDQSIYRFRGASFKAFTEFEKEFPGSESLPLTETYRLSPEITKVSATLIEANAKNRFRPDKKIIANSVSAGPVQVFQCASSEDEAFYAAEELSRLLKEGVSASQIGVLARSHRHFNLLVEEAERRSLPIQSLSLEALFEQEVVIDLLSFLKLLQSPNYSPDLLRLMNSDFLKIPAEEVYSFCQWAAPQRLSYILLLEKIGDSPLSAESKTKLTHFLATYKKLAGKLYRDRLSQILFEFLEETKIVQRLHTAQPRDLKILGAFFQNISEWESVQESKSADRLLPYLERMMKTEKGFEGEAIERDPQKISFLTVHASKGLEFDHVIVMGMSDQRFPLRMQKATWTLPEELSHEAPLSKESHLEEERRLLYVAFTRARNCLQLFGTQKKNLKFSQFLTEDLKALVADPSLLKWKELPLREAALEETFENIKNSRAMKPQITKKLTSTEGLRLSYTQLDRYERCPLSYYFQFELKLPTPPSTHLSFGIAVHSCLERFFKELQEHKEPEATRLLELFDEEFAEEIKKNPELPALLQEKGREQLQVFFDSHNGQFPKVKSIEQKFQLKVGKHTINGKIDRIDESSDGLEVVDYKTGKRSADAEKSDQLSIYALAVQEIYGQLPKSLRLIFLSENESVSVERSEKKLEKLKDSILETATAIQSQEFPPKPSMMNCERCEYSRICPSPYR